MKYTLLTAALASLVAAQTISMSASPTATVTYVVFDPDCSCHKTSTTTYCPATGTAVPQSTYTWWETECGCHKTAVVPAPMPTGNNYTAPMQPPAPAPAPAETTAPAAPAAPAPTTQPQTYQGGAMRVVGSIGVVMASFMAFAFLCWVEEAGVFR